MNGDDDHSQPPVIADDEPSESPDAVTSMMKHRIEDFEIFVELARPERQPVRDPTDSRSTNEASNHNQPPEMDDEVPVEFPTGIILILIYMRDFLDRIIDSAYQEPQPIRDPTESRRIDGDNNHGELPDMADDKPPDLTDADVTGIIKNVKNILGMFVELIRPERRPVREPTDSRHMDRKLAVSI